MSTKKKSSPETIVREIKRKTRRKYSAKDKIRIVLEGPSGNRGVLIQENVRHRENEARKEIQDHTK